MSALKTDIFNAVTPEFYRNMDLEKISKIPKNHADYIALRDSEKQKCINGVNINGIFIPGSLYYTLNHHKLSVDQEDGTIKIVLPDLRDNDWIMHEEYNLAAQNKEGFVLGSARQVGKSEFIVAMTLRQLFLFQNTEAVGVFTTKPDKDTFTKKAETAIKHGTDFIVVPNIDKDWTKDQIKFGIKQTNNEDFIYSRLYMYLNNKGNNTEVAAGKTISWYFMDEIAKEEMKATWEAVRPALRGKFGLRCSPVFAFTGGDVEKSQDAEGIYFNPEANNVRIYENSNKKTGFFMPATYRADFKIKQPFIDFYEKKYNVTIDKPSEELKSLVIYVADKELAKKTLDAEEELAQKESLLAYQKQKMYNPRTVKDMFIKGETNPFVHLKDYIEAHIEDLNANPRHRNYDIVNNKFVFSPHKNLTQYPLTEDVKAKLDKCPLSIVELPTNKYKEKSHVSGADPFNTIKTATSASLGSWYIIKKQTVDYTEEHPDSIVAWYNGRSNINHFRTKLLFALESYKSTLLHEAADDNTTQWFIDQDKSYLLEDSYALNKEITPKSKAQNVKGLRPTINTQNFYIELILQYLEEPLENGKLGLTRIPDTYLLEQILMFEGDLAPMDAIVGFGHALMHLHKEKKNIVRTWDYSQKEKEKGNSVRDPFNLFTTRKSSKLLI